MVRKLQSLVIVEYRRVRGDIETLTLRITCGFYEAETVPCSSLMNLLKPEGKLTTIQAMQEK